MSYMSFIPTCENNGHTSFNTSFSDIEQKVNEIAVTNNTYEVNPQNLLSHIKRLSDVENFSKFGLKSFGNMVGFPSEFISEIAVNNPNLANDIILDRTRNKFSSGANFCIREFLGKIQGAVSDKYNYFDDNEVIDLLHNTMFEKLMYSSAIITPERLHLRAVDNDKPFKINHDDSDLFFCYYIDNSMLGLSAFKIRLAVYRLECNNGLICKGEEFTICKKRHYGQKDIRREIEESVALLEERKSSIKEMILKSADVEAYIESLKSEQIKNHLKGKYNVSVKEAEKIITIYESYSAMFGKKSQWAFTNAVTEFARDIKDINRRELIEAKAFEETKAFIKKIA